MTREYELIAAAIREIHANQAGQPQLQELAGRLGVSPWQLQRGFQRWAGISPKRFLQHLTLIDAKRALRDGAPVLSAALASGLSGGSRLHDHFVVLESVTPGEYRSGGRGMLVRWGQLDSPFGTAVAGWTERGINWLAFVDPRQPERAFEELRQEWPNATLVRDDAAALAVAGAAFLPAAKGSPPRELRLAVRGTAFQVQVWRALLKIAPGEVRSYGDIAAAVERPTAARAVGTAIGSNPVSWLIPCHRVLRQNGALGGYRWGLERKQAMLAFESAQRPGADESRTEARAG